MGANTNKIDFTQRNQAIDILRALTVLLMIFVNDFWSVRNVPQWMKHAERGVDFLGLADIVYPIFLFVVGMSIPLALESRFRKGLPDRNTILHIFSRFFALLIMGAFTEQTLSGMSPDAMLRMPAWKLLMAPGFFLVWNTYPKTEKSFSLGNLHIPLKTVYTGLQILGVLLLCFLAYIFRDREGKFLRGSYGILGSIGWSYLVCAFVYYFVRNHPLKIFFFWLGLLLYTMARSNPPQLIPKDANIINDLMGIARIGSTTVLTMGGVLFTLLIVKYSQMEVRKQIIYLCSLIAGVTIAAMISHQFWIVAKLGATPTWVLYCTAIAICTYGLLHWAVVKGKAKWFNIIKAGGTATLACYVMPYFLQSVFHTYIPVLTQNNYYRFIDSIAPELLKTDATYMYCGLIKCFVWALLCILFTSLLGRFKINLKI